MLTSSLIVVGRDDHQPSPSLHKDHDHRRSSASDVELSIFILCLTCSSFFFLKSLDFILSNLSIVDVMLYQY
ncbi:hypothetical protein EUGRSUZ_D01703 [Eucalyptus grandis]|uniref:Uncharacterized protein n=2 Tax=Eucalyptus grandis TaxID=71139 RepID=A0ACC3L5S4_EUCGR|nr:hypothetical protein EUGRSUZ_D01703 [Eucalyptus grandis]